MKEELDKKLCEKYPQIFRDRHGDMRETCMCWGFDVGDGWYSIIDTLCNLIDNHLENKNSQRQYDIEYNSMVTAAKNGDTSKVEKMLDFMLEQYRAKRIEEILREDLRPIDEEVHQVVAVQVKEKFGGLRFYVNGGDEYINGAISMAENMSYSICEECGAPGKPTRSGWIQTLCESHMTEYQKAARIEEEKLLEGDNEFTEEELVGALYDVEGVITEESILKIYENRKKDI